VGINSEGRGAGDGPLDGPLSDLEPAPGRLNDDGSGTVFGDGALSVREAALGPRKEASEGGLGDGALTWPFSRSRSRRKARGGI
jgi:hypothetical protein